MSSRAQSNHPEAPAQRQKQEHPRCCDPAQFGNRGSLFSQRERDRQLALIGIAMLTGDCDARRVWNQSVREVHAAGGRIVVPEAKVMIADAETGQLGFERNADRYIAMSASCRERGSSSPPAPAAAPGPRLHACRCR